MLMHEIIARNARCHPEKEAIAYENQRITHGEMMQRVNRISNFMIGLGLKRGDRVSILSKNSIDYLVLYFGIFQAGGVVMPVNWRFTAGEMEYVINHSDSVCLIIQKEYLDLVHKMKDRLKGVKHFIVLDSDDVPEGMLNYKTLLQQASTAKPDVEVDGKDIAVQMYTSGTTGFPKGAMLSHQNYTATLFMAIVPTGMIASARLLVTAPLFHVAACTNIFLVMLVGGTAIIRPGFDPKDVLTQIEKEKITHTFFVPTMARMVLEAPGVENYNLSSLINLAFGGAPMTYELLKESNRIFKCDIISSFGQTESCGLGTNLPFEVYRKIAKNPDQYSRLLHSAGQDIPGLHTRIVDDQDRDVPPGTVGEIVFRGANVMDGYYKMPEETAQTLRGGWLHTGDMGYLDEEFFLYVVDRKKDMIISGGENIYCPEVERIIMLLEGVAEAAVVGIPHPKWGEVPKAFVVKGPNAAFNEKDVIEFCQNNLAKYKCPAEVVFIKELPRNAAGKVLKTELRKI